MGRARELAHLVSMGLALHFACRVHELRREWEAVGRLADELMALGERHDIPHFRAWAVTQQGAALLGWSDVEAGITKVRRGLAELQAAGDAAWRPFYATLLACALDEVGRADEGLALLEEVVSLVRDGQHVFEAEVHRCAGKLLLALAGRNDEAEARLLQAVEVAHSQAARSWELRAATLLARTWLERGRRRESLDLLAPLYRSFSEGSDTADVREAKAVLDALA